MSDGYADNPTEDCIFSLFMFMHLADAFIQSDLRWWAGRVRGSCLWTPTESSTFHAGD